MLRIASTTEAMTKAITPPRPMVSRGAAGRCRAGFRSRLLPQGCRRHGPAPRPAGRSPRRRGQGRAGAAKMFAVASGSAMPRPRPGRSDILERFGEGHVGGAAGQIERAGGGQAGADQGRRTGGRTGALDPADQAADDRRAQQEPWKARGLRACLSDMRIANPGAGSGRRGRTGRIRGQRLAVRTMMVTAGRRSPAPSNRAPAGAGRRREGPWRRPP